MSYKTVEGKAARKMADLLNVIEFDPAVFANCFSLMPEGVQERFAELALAMVQEWSAGGYNNVTHMPNVKLLTDIVTNETV